MAAALMDVLDGLEVVKFTDDPAVLGRGTSAVLSSPLGTRNLTPKVVFGF